MFKSKPSKPKEQTKEVKPRKPVNWLRVLTISNIVIVALVAVGLGGMAVLHQSDTNPNFCASCHIMQPNVNSYLTGTNLDHAHQQAGVQCKECHDYDVLAEVTSGINFVVGNYEVGADGKLSKRAYGNEMCLQCHISQDHVAQKTDFLERNPHDNHYGKMDCKTCHVSHGEQIDYCSQCHDNGGQRMVGQPVQDRGTLAH